MKNKFDFYFTDIALGKTFIKLQLSYLSVYQPLNVSHSFGVKLQEMFIAIFNSTNVCKNAFLISSYNTKLKSSCPEVFHRKGVLKTFAKHLCWSLLFNKVVDPWPATLLKKKF